MEKNNVVDMQEWLIEVENLKLEYNDLYLWFLESGYNNGDALSAIRDANKEEILYWQYVQGMNLQISYEVEELKEYDWNVLDKFGKENLLWDLGMDVRNFNYTVQERRVMKGTSLEMKEVVWGQERLDKEWCTKFEWDKYQQQNFNYYASEEARSVYWWRKKG